MILKFCLKKTYKELLQMIEFQLKLSVTKQLINYHQLMKLLNFS